MGAILVIVGWVFVSLSQDNRATDGSLPASDPAAERLARTSRQRRVSDGKVADSSKHNAFRPGAAKKQMLAFDKKVSIWNRG
jgi:hypothetical protein